MNIAGVEIGNGYPCRVVAEISNSHNGELARALRLIRMAKDAGADFVKFQCYTPAELVALRGDGPAPDPWGSQGWTMKALYEKAQTPHGWFPALVAECEAVGIPWFSSVFGEESLALLESLACPAYKIAALDVENHGLWESVLLTGRPIVASYRAEQWRAAEANFALYCPPGYPQTVFAWPALAAFDGFSYHGTDWRVPARAACYGARLVEVHVQFSVTPSELEANVCLDEHGLAALCEYVAGP